jgi:uncharacterized membrane protein HdeD (DUF308 family)
MSAVWERRRGAMLVVARLLSVVAGALIRFWPAAGAFALALRNAAGSQASHFTSVPAAP